MLLESIIQILYSIINVLYCSIESFIKLLHIVFIFSFFKSLWLLYVYFKCIITILELIYILRFLLESVLVVLTKE